MGKGFHYQGRNLRTFEEFLTSKLKILAFMDLLSLPPHVFVDIITWLPQKQNYRTVCKHWNTAIGLLIRTLHVEDKWLFAWAAFPGLETIILSGRVPWVNPPIQLNLNLELVQWIPPLGWLYNVRVKHLTWIGQSNSGQCLYNLLDDLSTNPSIKKLTLIGKEG